jgi:hypothetical protein
MPSRFPCFAITLNLHEQLLAFDDQSFSSAQKAIHGTAAVAKMKGNPQSE